jgi:hypothetical protein
MKTVRTALAALIATGLIAGLSTNFLVFGDDPPTTAPTTQPMQVYSQTPGTTQPAGPQAPLAGGPSVNNQYAPPNTAPAPKPPMTSIQTPGSDYNKPVDVQVGVGVGPAIGQSVPNAAVPAAGPGTPGTNGLAAGNPTTVPVAPATANPVRRR